MRLTSSHWGTYTVDDTAADGPRLLPLPGDPDPSPIGLSMLAAYRDGPRVQRPSVRASWLRDGAGARPDLRGREPFVEVAWDHALDLVAAEVERVRTQHGNRAIFGGSYGWSSAGRFHHAQSQVHRFLNATGGYVRHQDSYSLGAARVLMPHIVASMDELMASHHAWSVLVEHTKLFVGFGGVPAKNAQVSAGGNCEHRTRPGLAAMARAGCRFVNFSPVRVDLDAPPESVEWIPIRPGSDTAVMLALAHSIVAAGRHDRLQIERLTVGFERFESYLLGRDDGIAKDARWAAALSGVPADRIERLAHELCDTRSLVNTSWSLQRADHGEQPFWALVSLAACIGQIGLPGGGFGVGYGAANLMGSPHHRFAGPVLSQGRNAVDDFIPVARIADLLLHPGESFQYNGRTHRYADIRLVYWAGGNPFHHHQDLNRLIMAWRRPESIIVHEQVWNATAKMADIVLPATSSLERSDIGFSTREPLLVAMKPVLAPPGEARDDYAIFTALAQRLGCADVFTEGRDPMQWLRHMYEEARPRAAQAGLELPPFDVFWEAGGVRLPDNPSPPVMLADFRADPQTHRLKTPSGRIELFSSTIAGFGLPDCPGHATWFEPAEWLGCAEAARHPLHLLSDQPAGKLHSQLDFSAYSRSLKRSGREPLWLSTQDAAARGIRDGQTVRVFNDRGACLATAYVTPDILPGVARLATGAWFDPDTPGEPGGLERHGNPNVLTRDAGASGLSQGCSAQTCLVDVAPWHDPDPAVRAFEPPAFTTALL